MAQEEEPHSALLRERLNQRQAEERDALNYELVEIAREVRDLVRTMRPDVDAIRFRVGFILFLMLAPLIIGFTIGLVVGIKNG
jgi:hypothetical protein